MARQRVPFDQQPFTWIAALVNTCLDCLPRHGEQALMSEWEGQGLPGTGWSVCGDHCQCGLMPSDLAGDVSPLQRVRTTQSGLTARQPRDLDNPDLSTIEARRAMRRLGQQNDPNQAIRREREGERRARQREVSREEERQRRAQLRQNAQRRQRARARVARFR